MTHPLHPLTDQPIFASMMNDPQFGDLARQLLDPMLPTHEPHVTEFEPSSSLAPLGHPLRCRGCSTASFSFALTNPYPPAVNRGLALLPGSKPPTLPRRSARARKPASQSKRGDS